MSATVVIITILSIASLTKNGKTQRISLERGEHHTIPCNSPIPKTTYKPHSVTLVTAFFRFSKSKHTPEKYNEWMRTFFASIITTPMVIYASPAVINDIIAIRENITSKPLTHLGGPILFVSCDDVWSLAWINRQITKPNWYRNWRTVYEERQPLRDNYREEHSPELYAIWNQKPWLTAQAAKQNPFDSTYFLWVDIGSFRSGYVYLDWPSKEKINCIFYSPETREKLLMGMVGELNLTRAKLYKKEDGPEKDGQLIQGTIFGGNANIVVKFEEEHRMLHDYFADRDMFIGREEFVFGAAVYHNFREKIFFLPYQKFVAGAPIKDPWFHFVDMLANPSDSDCDDTEFVRYKLCGSQIQCASGEMVEIRLPQCNY